MATLDTNPWVWVKDMGDNLYLCPYDQLRDPNMLFGEEKERCIHDASELGSMDRVPSNSPEGRIRFAASASSN